MNAMWGIGYTIDNVKCCFFQIFAYLQELFAVFSSILIRMYINCTIKSLSSLLSLVSLADEKRVMQIISKYANIFLNNF